MSLGEKKQTVSLKKSIINKKEEETQERTQRRSYINRKVIKASGRDNCL